MKSLLLSLILFCSSSCEDFDYKFSNKKEVLSEDLFKKGWMQYYYLPEDATNIEHTHNLDTNLEKEDFIIPFSSLSPLIESCSSELVDGWLICKNARLECVSDEGFPTFCKKKQKYYENKCHKLKYTNSNEGIKVKIESIYDDNCSKFPKS